MARGKSNGRILVAMADKTFLIKLANDSIQHVRAARMEVHGQHMVFLTAGEKLAAIFLIESVKSWNELP